MATAVTSTTLTPLDRETPPRPSLQSASEQTPTTSIHNLPLEPATPSSPTATQPESTTITEPDPNAFKVTILLASSGYRTQISVNRSLLEKESSVEGEGFLVSQLKNVLWKDWPSDWPDGLPPSPNYLRLIYSGKMLADKSTLSDCGIGPNKPNILHLSIRPADFVDDEFDSGKKLPGSPRRAGGNGCCNCIIS